MVSLQDFSKVGDTAVFLGEPAIDFVEQQMMERGYLDSREMSNMFNLLRSNDLIWSNVVNNYLLGQKPPAFDLLYWNSDGTRMTRAAHSWYLRNTYVENNLIEPEKIHLKGEALDLGRITLDAYAVGAEKDHIVPWAAAWRLTQLTNGKVRYVLASSGHIAGIINPRGARGSTGSMLETVPPTRPRSGGRRARAMTAAGGRTGRAGWPGIRAAKACCRRWAARRIRRWTTRRDVTCWRSSWGSSGHSLSPAWESGVGSSFRWAIGELPQGPGVRKTPRAGWHFGRCLRRQGGCPCSTSSGASSSWTLSRTRPATI